ncbi:acyl-CoA N-acyltransferase, partial [Delitschia confertaspora ATCC 74209]
DGIRLACFPPRFTSSSNPSEELHWRAARYVAAASLGAVRSVKAIDEKAGGRIVGAAGYLEPGEFQCVDTEMSGERKCKDMPSCCDEDALDEVRRVLRSKREGVLRGDWNVWELSQVFVDPSYQRQGVGRKLLEWGIKQADQDGVPMYLEATPPGKVMYERLGFEVLDVAEFPGI